MVLGKVTEVMKIVNKIAATNTGYSDRLLENQVMKSVTIDTLDVECPEHEKL